MGDATPLWRTHIQLPNGVCAKDDLLLFF